jgi:hypothetical protein
MIMGCRGCEDKPSRYGGVKMENGDMDREQQNEYQQQGTMNQPADPMSAFFSAKQFSYEELKSRQEFSMTAAKQQSDHIMGEMTDAMRQIHLEELIATVNCDEMSIPGMAPDHAIVAMKRALDREDFFFVMSLYPELKAAVAVRYEVILSNRLPGRKVD